MPTRVENLKLTEISFCEKGANEGARVTILKRAFPLNPLLPSNSLLKAKPRHISAAEERALGEKLEAGPPPVSAAEERALGERLDDDEETTVKHFDDAVAAVRNRAARLGKKMSRTAAMEKARHDYPKLFDQYQSAPLAKIAPHSVEKSDAILKFERIVDRVQHRDRCSRLDALTQAAREFPAERAAYAAANS